MGCSDIQFEGFVPDVEVSPYKALLGRREVRDVLQYVGGEWLSVTVKYSHSVHHDP